MEKPPGYYAPSKDPLNEPPPAYDDDLTEAAMSSPGSSHSTVLQIGNFPSRFNWYYHNIRLKTSTYHLGEHRKEPQFSLMLEATWKGTRMTLHDGVGDSKKLLAEAYSESSITRHSIIHLPAPQDGEEVREELRCHSSMKTNSYTFSMRVPGPFGEKPVVEQFEWRQSHGSEVRSLDKYGWGYKLVRLHSSGATSTAPPTDDLTKSEGKKAVRHEGLTSDGKEVVAVWADNSQLSKNKMGKFQFLGSGATGELGEDWATFAVM
jgi:hypothetical protein